LLEKANLRSGQEENPLIWHRWNQADTRYLRRIAAGAGLLCLMVQPTAAMAQQSESFTCTLTDQVRKVERIYESGGAPCMVRYFRNDQPVQTVWRARESGSVCVDGARKMIQDFQAAGYSCTGPGGELVAASPAPEPSPAPAPQPAPQPTLRNGTTGPDEPAAGTGQSRPAGSPCYALTYEACGPDGSNCDVKPASICAQSDTRWQMTDDMPADLDPLTRFLPGEPGKCYRVYREGQPRPLCTEAPGSPNTVWSLR
jgi:hypothetical protein